MKPIKIPFTNNVIVDRNKYEMTVKRLSEEIDELKDRFEYHKKIHKYNNLMLEPKIKEFEQRLDQLEEAIELKEYLDEDPLNEEENE